MGQKAKIEAVSEKTKAARIDGKWYPFGEKVRLEYVKKGEAEVNIRDGKLEFVKMLSVQEEKKEQPQHEKEDKSELIVDLLRQILAELKSLDIDRTVWAAVPQGENGEKQQ